MAKKELALRADTPLRIGALKARSLAAFHNAIDWNTGGIPASRAPSDDEIASFRASAGRLREALAERDQEQVARAVAQLLASYARPIAANDAAMTVSAYLAATYDLPSWAVCKACEMWGRGEVEWGNVAFPPSSGELCKVARGIIMPYQRELAELQAVLSAPVEPEKPKRPLEDIRKEHGENWGIDDKDAEAERERREQTRQLMGKATRNQRRRHCIAMGYDPDLGCSVELLQRCGIEPKGTEKAA